MRGEDGAVSSLGCLGGGRPREGECCGEAQSEEE